ncbi:MAG: LruC domain-containing protein [Bacteroidota bacterium]
MRFKHIFLASILLSALTFQSCLDTPEVAEPTIDTPNEIEQLFIPQGFEFGMAYNQEVTLLVKDAVGAPIAGVLFSLYTAPLSQGGKLLGKGITDLSGSLTTEFEIPYGKEALYAYTDFDPLPKAQRLELSGLPIVHEWGSTPVPREGAAYRFASGSENAFSCQTGLYQSIDKQLKKLNVTTGTYITVGTASKKYNGIGYNSEDNLIYGIHKLNDIDYELWRFDNTGIETNLGVISGVGGKGLNYKSDFDGNGNLCIAGEQDGVWKFVTIDVDQTPLTAVTQTLTKIGTVRNIYDIAYNPILGKFYSIDQQGHLVVIDRQALTVQRIADYSGITGSGACGAVWSDLTGDIVFSQNKSGNIYHVGLDESGNPGQIQFIMQGEKTNNNDGASCALVASPFADSDGDGVLDEYDSYPDDPTRIYTDYSPAQGSVGSYAFEDKWPKKGDYDFNDLIVDYSYEFAKNAKNQVGSMRATFTTRIVGATFQLGFGFQLDDLIVEDVLSVTGADAPSIETEVNGLETFQDQPVIVVIDDIHRSMGSSPGNFINAGSGISADQHTISVTINFAEPVDDVGTINPFIYTQNLRYVEIHLKGFEPTDKAAPNYFGTEDDASSGSNTYQTSTGLPWALNFPQQWTPPKEHTLLNEAYPDFSEWVGSNGSSKTDWYETLKANSQKLNPITFPEEGNE